MTRLRWAPAAAALALAVACTGPAPSGPPANRPPVQVQLLALNDFHGNLEPPSGSTGAIDGTPAGGVERLATLLADLSAANGTSNTITVAAGDLIGVSPLLSAAFHDEPSVEALCSGTRVPTTPCASAERRSTPAPPTASP